MPASSTQSPPLAHAGSRKDASRESRRRRRARMEVPAGWTASTFGKRRPSVKKKISRAGFPNRFHLCIIRAPLGGLHFGAAGKAGRERQQPSRGVDSLESRGKMCGSLQRNAFGPDAEDGGNQPSTRC
ncbi:hypothetical protein LUTEI9C_120048 [Luteimonas sp. 9C]|nr:hypothetical protein LUTEI9C_120048 [Luteimonas sp. 9C]